MEEQVQRYLEEAFPFWQKLSSADRGRLLSHTAEVAYRAGENVHGGKNGCTGLVVVVSGRLRPTWFSEEGRGDHTGFQPDRGRCLRPISEMYDPQSRSRPFGGGGNGQPVVYCGASGL